MTKKTLIILFIMVFAIPLLCLAQPAGKKIQKMSFDFVDADVRNVLRGLADVMGKNIIIGDDVKELKDKTITLKLDNISTEEALDVIIKSKDLAKFEEGNVLRVITLKKFYDEKKREGDDKAAFVKEKLEKLKQGEEFVTETIFVNYTTAKNVVKVIKGEATATSTPATPGAPGAASVAIIQKGLLSEYGMVTEVEWTNAIIVKDTRENIALIKKIISEHDFPPAQVQIHARIVVADTNFSRDLGIKWSAAMEGSSNFLNRDMKLTPAVTATNNAATSGAFAFLVGNAAASFFLDGVLSMAEADGLSKTIANPKVVTSDNQKAKISKGDEIPYQTIAQTGATPTIEYKKAELSLEVTPHVTKDGKIKMTIKATKNEPYTYSAGVIALKTKEAITDVIINDGETVVIGGIYENFNEESEAGIPLLMKIPVLGWLFKNKHNKDTKTELLIFVTPTILKNLYKEEG
jgi:type IV pilus assembly protein PilQ